MPQPYFQTLAQVAEILGISLLEKLLLLLLFSL